jgi:hypothetical protein
VRDEVVKIESFFQVVTENAASYATWKTLLIAHRVSGVQVHDARLVAVMMTYGIPQVITFNVADFTRYHEIEAVHPDKVG